MLFIGCLCSVGTGVCQPLNVLIFGTLTGDLISFATIIGNPGNVTEAEFLEAQEKFMDDIISFAVYNSLIGLGMLILSYMSTMLFNYSAIRQASFITQVLINVLTFVLFICGF